jgi:hypothetical protein
MSTRESSRPNRWILLLVLAYALIAGGYFAVRYGGRWSDSDTTNLTTAMASVSSQGTITPTTDLYGLGFAYQAVSSFVVLATGLSFAELQLLVYPLLAAGLSVIAYAMYRALTGDPIAGALAALLLFLQPEFLFVIFRGSHEKLTWLLTMLAVFILSKSFTQSKRPARLAIYVGLFYLAALGLVASNAFFASSFILAVAVSLLGGLAVWHLHRRQAGTEVQPGYTRLLYVVVSATVLWFLNTFYLYQPALRVLLDLKGTMYRASAVALGMEPVHDPYATVSYGWVSPMVFVGLMLPTMIVGAISLLLWAGEARRRLRAGGNVGPEPRFLLWLLYGGFGLQLGASIMVAWIGGIASNLQYRLLPVVMPFAIGLVATAITNLWGRWAHRTKGRLLAAALAVFVLWGSFASLLKATNDPWLSNYWIFRTKDEVAARRWVDEHLQHTTVWLGLDGSRLGLPSNLDDPSRSGINYADSAALDDATRHVVLSVVDTQLGLRRGQPLPEVGSENLVYDSGGVVQYHLRPKTPYQR